MILVCPKPLFWNNIYKELKAFAGHNFCTPSSPPVPLILSGWVFTNDSEKQKRWQKTIEWAKANGCSYIVDNIPEENFYYAYELLTCDIGPTGGSCYRPWDFECKPKHSEKERLSALEHLRANWIETVGNEMGNRMYPKSITGVKGRRLLVYADNTYIPPWGTWDELSFNKAMRITFTNFRAAINKAIAPYEVDHIDFIPISNFDLTYFESTRNENL
jgi:hypothetical protein